MARKRIRWGLSGGAITVTASSFPCQYVLGLSFEKDRPPCSVPVERLYSWKIYFCQAFLIIVWLKWVIWRLPAKKSTKAMYFFKGVFTLRLRSPHTGSEGRPIDGCPGPREQFNVPEMVHRCWEGKSFHEAPPAPEWTGKEIKHFQIYFCSSFVEYLFNAERKRFCADFLAAISEE